MKVRDLYGGEDPAEIPAYRIRDVAYYLNIPKSTLRSWSYGQNYKTKTGKHWFRPLIRPADPQRSFLSFMNLVEAHVLTALRRQHFVPLPVIREALRLIVEGNPASKHPLADHQFATVGKTLFIEEAGRLTNVTQDGQLGLKECLERYLRRIERGEGGVAARLYPFRRFYRDDWQTPPQSVVIDPRIAYGRPTVVGTGVPTGIIAERFITGENLDEIAEDYDTKPEDILEAIRWELAPAA